MNKVFAVYGNVETMKEIIVVEVDEKLAIAGVVAGKMDSFFDTKEAAQARLRTVRKQQDNVWK